jgi:hypothetical protein
MPARSSVATRRSGNLIVFFVATTLTGTALAQKGAGCERETVSTSVSPGDAWVALVQEEICSDGHFVTTFIDKVQMVRRDLTDTIKLGPRTTDPVQENDVLAVDVGPRPEDRPRLQWLSPEKLQITLPSFSVVGSKKVSYQGLDIIAKFEPDDPLARDRFLKDRGLPPD